MRAALAAHPIVTTTLDIELQNEAARAVTAAGDSIAIGRPALYRAATLPYREALRAGADAFVALAEGREPRE